MTGDHQVIHGEALQWLRSLPDACADAVITDPPYSSGGMFRGDRATGTAQKYVKGGDSFRPDFCGDTRDQRSFMTWCTLWLHEALRVTRPGGALLMFTDWRQLPIATDAVQCGGWVWRGIGVWDKRCGKPNKGGFARDCEFIVHATAGAVGRFIDIDMPCLRGVLPHTIRQSDKHHQTGKPTQLLRELCGLAPPGGLILDPFAGSGTTVVAAALEGRRAWGCELSPEYQRIAEQRIAEVVDMRGAAEQAGLFEAAP